MLCNMRSFTAWLQSKSSMKKSRKKSPQKRKSGRCLGLHLLFWLCIAAGGLWVAFAPKPPRYQPQTVHVKVEQPPEPESEPPVIYDEKAQVEVPQVQPQVPASPPRHIGPNPEIAIVIDDVGLDLKGSKRAINLPAYITLSFMPYATRLREQTKEARDNGHELMLHMPMEPMGHDDPGPGALFVNLPPEEQRQRFETALASFVGFDGVNNHMGSKFTADPAGMEMVVDELQQRHLFFLDSRTSAKTVGEKIAREHGLSTIARDVFLDDTISADAIRAQLVQTEHVAKRKGYAVAIGHPHAVTMEVLEQWLPQAEAAGFKLVPVKELLQ